MAHQDDRALFPLADHFAYPEQQVEAGKMGMWLFLATEILFFGGLFVAYTIYNWAHPDLFQEAHKFLNVRLGAINTIVLLFSSLTVVLAIHAIQQDKKKTAVINLAITIVCAVVFLVIKYFEYEHKIHAGLLPGLHFTNAELSNPDQIHIFFGIYFLLTGLHGIHVVIGIGVLVWIMLRTIKGDFSSQYYLPMECSGLYWHLVDVIWIFLFPLLYLIA